jgi:hypothetical protein
MALPACLLDSLSRREPDIGNMIYSYFLIKPLPNGDCPLFTNNQTIEYAILGRGTKTIPLWAFRWCGNLKFVVIPDSVGWIGYAAFSGCTSLSSVTIPDSVTGIGASAFQGCTSLSSVTIPDSVTNIGQQAFHGCTSLSSVTIPDSVTSISDDAFWDCMRLMTISISTKTVFEKYTFPFHTRIVRN